MNRTTADRRGDALDQLQCYRNAQLNTSSRGVEGSAL